MDIKKRSDFLNYVYSLKTEQYTKNLTDNPLKVGKDFSYPLTPPHGKIGSSQRGLDSLGSVQWAITFAKVDYFQLSMVVTSQINRIFDLPYNLFLGVH